MPPELLKVNEEGGEVGGGRSGESGRSRRQKRLRWLEV